MVRAGAAVAALWCAHALAAVPAVGQTDSTFLLTTGDPMRSPSPFLGNGRAGVVVPALGLGATRSFVAGLYEHGPGDVPRLAAGPAWNAVPRS